MPGGRPPPPAPVEAAAYLAVAEAPDDAAGPGAGRAAVSVAYGKGVHRNAPGSSRAVTGTAP